MAEGCSEKFDIKIVHDNFLQCMHESDDVRLQCYLESYKELYKFFNLMGTVFGFVSSDLKSKIDILETFLNDATVTENFVSVKIMMRYEIDAGLLQKKDYVSGSRTLLRLHRGLDFIRQFMRALGELQNGDKTSTVCQAAYEKTLAQYHPWIVQKGAKMAMYTMPTREQLLRRVCGNTDQEVQRAIDILPKMLEVTTYVYDRIEALYTVHDLHGLP
ncbi:uncharacterized protein CBL_12905 [Carabus blaptoides fortunei]